MKFEPGKTYTCRSIGDHNCIYSYKVTARTEKTITIREDNEKERRVKVQKPDADGVEWAYPNGRYSMCPIIRASRAS